MLCCCCILKNRRRQKKMWENWATQKHLHLCCYMLHQTITVWACENATCSILTQWPFPSTKMWKKKQCMKNMLCIENWPPADAQSPTSKLYTINICIILINTFRVTCACVCGSCLHKAIIHSWLFLSGVCMRVCMCPPWYGYWLWYITALACGQEGSRAAAS